MRPPLRPADIWEGDLVRWEGPDGPLLVTRVDGRLVAWRDRCPHLGQPLSGGALDRDELTCGAHGWRFDVRTGQGRNPRGCQLEAAPLPPALREEGST